MGLLAVLATGCDESVDPRLDIDRPFSFWGLINPKADTHAVRVFEIEPTIRLIQPDPLDAVVTSTLLQTGQTAAWRDSVVQLADGDYRHVFWAAFDVAPGQRYRLEVRRSDGAVSWAETTVPPPVTLEILDVDFSRVLEAIQPVLVRGDAPNLPRIDVDYQTRSLGPSGAVFPNPVLIPYAGKAQRAEEGWLVGIDLKEDFVQILFDFEQKNLPVGMIELLEINLRVHVGDENWVSPIGVFDAEFLVEPGVFSNVENGFGFFGSGYVEAVTVRPPSLLLERAGFHVEQ